MGRLIVYGDMMLDIRVNAATFPEPGQDAIVDGLAFLPGGSAANCAATAARLGAQVEFMGITGRDPLPGLLVDDLKKYGVGTRYLREIAGAVGATIAIIGGAGERTFFSYRGAHSAISYGPTPSDLIAPDDIVHLSGYSFQTDASRDTALSLMNQAKGCGARISLDPSFHFARDFALSEILTALDFIFPNQDEAVLMTGAASPAEAATILRERGAKTVVIKMGRDGCMIESEHTKAIVPAYSCTQIVDTIGAGDAFCGGFLTGILWGLGEKEAAYLGHAAALKVIEQIGGHSGAPTLEDLLKSGLLPPSVSEQLSPLNLK